MPVIIAKDPRTKRRSRERSRHHKGLPQQQQQQQRSLLSLLSLFLNPKWWMFLLGLVCIWTTVVQHTRLVLLRPETVSWTKHYRLLMVADSTTTSSYTTNKKTSMNSNDNNNNDNNNSTLEEDNDEIMLLSSIREAWSSFGMPLNQLLHTATGSSTNNTCTTHSTTTWSTTTKLQSYPKEPRNSNNNNNNKKNRNNRQYNNNNSMTFDPHVPQKSRYAYAFLLGGALSDKSDSDYRGGLFSTIVAAHALRRQGSTADMIIMVQLSVRSNATNLPQQEEDLLRRSNIRIVYIPKFAHPKLEVFYSLQLEKFRILLLDGYSRVTYLDNDILPYCNLDYLMELSDGDKGTTTTTTTTTTSTSDGKPKRLLQDNVLMAFKTEPSSGGFFVLRPSAKDYERLQQVILQKEQRGLELPYPHFDEIEGWGTIIPNDQPWKTLLGQTGTNWTWHGANCDQGLLLYWTKFIQKKVSIIIGHTIEQWTSHPDDDDDSHSHHHPPMLGYVDSSNALYQFGCSTPSRVRWLRNAAPYNSFTHLTGRSKPWHGNLTEYQHAMAIKKDQLDSMTDKELWFWLLQDALKNIGMTENVSLDFISSETRQPAVGRAPSFAQMALFLRYKSKHGWKQYEYEKEVEEDDDNNDNSNSAGHHNEQDDNKHIQPVTDRNNNNHNNDDDDDWHSQQKYAYAFLLGGARSEKPGSDYRGGLYSVVVAAHLLRKHGSQADVVLMVQISAETDHTALPDQEEKLLQMVGIKIMYIPKFSSPKYECFYSLMMEKFRILSLIEYKRVMYLDYDVMPRCNMDYLFHLSDPSPTSLRLSEEKEPPHRRRFFRLKENVGVAFKSDPANGGIFILTPNADDFQHIQRIIHQKEVHALKLPFPHWNETIGWGHVIQSPDIWRSLWGRNGTSWSWYGAVADQGLLYYWIKYVKKSVSLIIKHEVEQWEANEHGVLEREEDLNGNALDQYGCAKDLGPRKQLGPSPYSDFVHLTGRSKPWNSNREDLEQAIQQKKFKDCNDREKWYFSLVEALKEVGMHETISMDFILGKDEIPAVGIAPSYQQMAQYLIYKRRNGWRQYEKERDEPDVIRSLTVK